ncbi:DUF5829 family protein [Sinomicrobium sp. M5D2P9]
MDKKNVEGLFTKADHSIGLDHLYIVLDSSSYSAFISNTFIKEVYAGIDLGMPKFEPFSESATSVYLRGRKEYIEILGPNNAFKEPVGQNGIGFFLENDNGFSLENTPVLKEEGTKFLTGVDTVSFGLYGKQITWYKAFYTLGMKTNLYTWHAYYNPGFLSAVHQEDVGKYSQELFLKTAYQPEKLFKKITGIEMHCNRADHYRIATELQLLGCALEKKEGNDLVFTVGDVQLSILLDEMLTNSRITRIDGLLNRKDDRVLDFNGFKIKNQGFGTSWIFEPRP